eukprot:11400383-Heterocapsa_arctica.AAC.1
MILEHENATAGSVRIRGSGQTESLLTDQEMLDIAKSKERWQSRVAVLEDPTEAAARKQPNDAPSDKKGAKKAHNKHYKKNLA